MLLEICANSVESALAAQNGGADRVELCDNLFEGGTTPSFGAIFQARKLLSINLHVIIRPRGGDFFYNSNEKEILKHDIKECKNQGVDGVVFGMLKPDGNIDKDYCSQLIELAYPMKTTFHRAFDMVKNPYECLEDIITAGFDILLTSGLQNKAELGTELIADLIDKSKNRIAIMPGSGINENNILEIAKKTNASNFHVSLRKTIESRMIFRNNTIKMGGIQDISEYLISVTDENRVKNIRKIINEYYS